MHCSLFELQHSQGCNNDYLEIREGNSTGTLVGHFCGNTLPSNYTSLIGHVLWIKFVSDSSVSGAGFRAMFTHCNFIPLHLINLIIEVLFGPCKSNNYINKYYIKAPNVLPHYSVTHFFQCMEMMSQVALARLLHLCIPVLTQTMQTTVGPLLSVETPTLRSGFWILI